MLLFHLIHLLNRTKRVETPLGIVADFCPFCHNARPFKIKRVGSKKLFSTGRGKLLNHEIECTVCGARLSGNPLTYETFEPAKARTGEISELIRTTYPQFWENHAPRLEFEEQLRKSPDTISSATRAKYMMEIFRLLNLPVVACYKAEMRFDGRAGTYLVVTLLLSLACLVASDTIFSRTPHEDTVLLAGIWVLLGGALVTMVQVALVPSRFFKKNLMPRLARGLAPLEPIRGELEAVLAKCKADGLLIGKKVKSDRLLDQIGKILDESARDRGTNALPIRIDAPQSAVANAGRHTAERARKILQPFHLYNNTVEDFYARGTHFDKPATLGCLGTIVCAGTLITLALTTFVNSPHNDMVACAAGLVLAAGSIYTVVQVILVPSRFMQKNVVTKLALALQPLDPTNEEITRALEKCKIIGLLIGEKIKPVQLAAVLKNTSADRQALRDRVD